MTMWIIIMWTTMAFVITSLFYVGSRIPHMLNIEGMTEWGKFKQFSLGLLITLGFMGIIILCINFVNAIVCVMYLAMIWAVSDVAFWLLEKFWHITFEHYYTGWIALTVTTIALAVGWYLNHHVWQTEYTLKTAKNIEPLKIVMFADSHIGTTFDAKGFAAHVQKMEAQKPDAVIVAGDFVDDDTSKQNMIEAVLALGKIATKYGVYFAFGNHDFGYYGAERRGFSAVDLIVELEKNGVKVLRDETVLIADRFYIIGRRDRSTERERRGHRKTMAELVQNLDQSKYMLVIDHQPADYEKQAAAGVDLVLSGHTHGGQLFPFNQVGKWIGANDFIYGHEKRQNTDFIVTSGISDWAIKFKTGTKSEYVVINIQPEK